MPAAESISSRVSDNAPKNNESPEVSNKIQTEAQEALRNGANPSPKSNGDTAAPVGGTNGASIDAGGITFHSGGTDSPSSQPKFDSTSTWQGIENVAKTLGSGALDEIVNHPGRVLENAAIGAAVGVGAVLAAPEVAIGAAVVGAGVGAYELAKNVGGWIQDAKVVANPEAYSRDQVDKATNDIRNVGAGGVDTAAGIIGGMAGGFGASALKSSFTEAASGEAAAVEPRAVESAPKEEVSPEVAASIKTNQGLFDAAKTDQSVMTVQKQDYNVMFKKVNEPTTITTLETKAAGTAGEQVKPGQWIATRLDSQGNPVVENDVVNQWPVTEKQMLKAYKIDSNDLANSDQLIAGTKTDGPPVHMVQLKDDLTLNTSWGTMKGHAGDYLANYDYNTAMGRPGEDFAIVTNTSFKQTYELAK